MKNFFKTGLFWLLLGATPVTLNMFVVDVPLWLILAGLAVGSGALFYMAFIENETDRDHTSRKPKPNFFGDEK